MLEYDRESDCYGASGFFSGCGSWEWLVPVFVFIYLFVVSIVLTNLLIAAFAKR